MYDVSVLNVNLKLMYMCMYCISIRDVVMMSLLVLLTKFFYQLHVIYMYLI